METASRNFAFLAVHDPQLVRLGALAERYFADDPSTSLIKLRQFGEVLAHAICATCFDILIATTRNHPSSPYSRASPAVVLRKSATSSEGSWTRQASP